MTAKAGIALLLLLGAAYPVEQQLRKQAPETPAANRIGMGRLMGGVLTGPFRPMLQTYLWLRTDILYGQGRFDELQVLIRTMTALYPDNNEAKDFLGWLICFNYKNEAPTPEIEWTWSREGLDILADLPSSQRRLADWFLKQCGQNPVRAMRYAGPEWQAEKILRARATEWAKGRFPNEQGPLHRFDIGLRFLEGHTKFFDQLRRLPLLMYGATDDCLRTGHSQKLTEAADLARWMSKQLSFQGMKPPEGWKELFEERAWVFGQLAQARASPRMVGIGRYEIAASLWGIGAHRKDAHLLRMAHEAMRAYATESGADCSAEMAAIRDWIAHAKDPSKPRPGLPFD